MPMTVTHWSLTTLREKPIKIEAKVVTHSHYVIFQMAEVAGADAVGDSHPMLVSLTGQVIGTLPYMSPEQARGDPNLIDIRTNGIRTRPRSEPGRFSRLPGLMKAVPHRLSIQLIHPYRIARVGHSGFVRRLILDSARPCTGMLKW